MPSTVDLYTTVKNLMGVDHVFGYIPPHGRKLLAQSTYTTPGDLWDRVLGRAPGGYSRVRFKSLERDLLAGRIGIESTPKPVFWDPTAAAVAPLANPTVAVITGTTGTQPNAWAGPTGAYYISYTYVNANGETALGASRSAGTVTLTNGTTKLQVNIPTPASS